MNRRKISAHLRQKWWLALIMAALLIGYLIWKIALPDANTNSIENIPAVTEQTETTPNASMPSDEIITDTALNEEETLGDGLTNTDSSNVSNDSSLDPKTILNAPLPETDSLAKEEIDRLADERQRLAEQEKLAAEQLAMNKKLTEMKAEQIALLEQQIAELEANETASE